MSCLAYFNSYSGLFLVKQKRAVIISYFSIIFAHTQLSSYFFNRMRYQALSLALLGLGKSYAAHFSDTCNSFDLQGSLLMAKCSKSPNGYYYDTVVDLNKCVGNKDGVLIRGYALCSLFRIQISYFIGKMSQEIWSVVYACQQERRLGACVMEQRGCWPHLQS